MPKSIVIALQEDALDSSIRVTDLLRTAMVVARKLKVDEFADWINRELSGYEDANDVPPYRIFRGEIRGLHPYHGKVPIIVEDVELAEVLTQQRIAQPISEIEVMVAKDRGGIYLFPKKTEAVLMAQMEYPFPPFLDIPPTQLARVVDIVRNTILSWALQLEEDGIFGDDLRFTTGELSSAAEKTYTVNNFFGDIQQAQFQHGASGSPQIMHIEGANLEAVGDFLTTLKESIPELGLDTDAQGELEADMKSAESQLQSPKPKTKIIKDALGSIYKIVAGAAKTALTNKLIEELSQLL